MKITLRRYVPDFDMYTYSRTMGYERCKIMENDAAREVRAKTGSRYCDIEQGWTGVSRGVDYGTTEIRNGNITITCARTKSSSVLPLCLLNAKCTHTILARVRLSRAQYEAF